MYFYNLWNNIKNGGISDLSFIECFLKRNGLSENAFRNGSDDDLLALCNFMYSYDINMMIGAIDSSYLSSLTPDMIVQFSNFKCGIEDVPRIIFEQNRELKFDEIGELLLGKRDPGAMKKYGENHSKLAELFSLVELSDTKPTLVKNTNFGNFCVMIDERLKMKMFRILAMRDPLIKNLIFRAKNGHCSYKAEASCLSESTMIRRRSNVKTIFEFILKNTDFEYLIDVVEW